ncbi:MAG TPA: class I SAM-dependent methyltransferase [Vicinamibacterales bacterium]
MRTLVFIALLSLGTAGYAQTQEKPQEPFVPRSGQPGKDVVWVPSPPEMVNKMLEVAKVTASDFVMDLGSGDGRNIIAAAKLGARGVGVEYNPDMVALSRRLAKEAGVADKAQFVEGDMYEADISKATVMALFLLPVNLNKLQPKFLDLAPGTRIVANTFGIDGWEPDYRTTLPQGSECESWCDVLLWIVPAKVAGTWNLSNGGRLVLTQENQMVQGTATINGEPLTLSKGRMNGDEITFVAGTQTFTGKVKGNRIEGKLGTATVTATKQ